MISKMLYLDLLLSADHVLHIPTLAIDGIYSTMSLVPLMIYVTQPFSKTATGLQSYSEPFTLTLVPD